MPGAMPAASKREGHRVAGFGIGALHGEVERWEGVLERVRVELLAAGAGLVLGTDREPPVHGIVGRQQEAVEVVVVGVVVERDVLRHR